MMASISGPKNLESKAALLEHMRNFEGRAIVLGRNAEAPRGFYSFSIACEGKACEVGVISSGLGTKPAAAFIEGKQRVVVGHDATISWIDLNTATVAATKQLPGVFYRFLHLAGSDDILVIHELGAVRIDGHGSGVWEVHSDVVEEAALDAQGNLVIASMDAPTNLIVSVKTGQILNAN